MRVMRLGSTNRKSQNLSHVGGVDHCPLNCLLVNMHIVGLPIDKYMG